MVLVTWESRQQVTGMRVDDALLSRVDAAVNRMQVRNAAARRSSVARSAIMRAMDQYPPSAWAVADPKPGTHLLMVRLPRTRRDRIELAPPLNKWQLSAKVRGLLHLGLNLMDEDARMLGL